MNLNQHQPVYAKTTAELSTCELANLAMSESLLELFGVNHSQSSIISDTSLQGQTK